METSLSCPHCTADAFHCHELSVVHADGATSCGDPWCTLPHHLHEWQAACGSPAAAACGCGAAAPGAVVQLDVGQSGGRRYTDTWLSLAS